MFARPVAFLSLMAVLAACGELTLEDGDPRTRNTCVFHADDPHFSTHGANAGRREINAVAWFKCSSSPPDVTLYLKLEQQSGGAWLLVKPNSTEVRHPKVGKKYSIAAPIACLEGVYRTAAKITGHDVDGRAGESTWDYSQTVKDPCKGKP